MRERRRVLVVEDERTIAESIAARLRAEGFTVDLAQDGPSAVAAARLTKPDLVVLDIMLPGFDGLEVCRRVRSTLTSATLPIIILTARDGDANHVSALDLGAEFSGRVVAYARDDLEKHPGWESTGLLLNSPRPDALRFMPALNVTRDEIDRMIEGAQIAIQAVR